VLKHHVGNRGQRRTKERKSLRHGGLHKGAGEKAYYKQRFAGGTKRKRRYTPGVSIKGQ